MDRDPTEMIRHAQRKQERHKQQHLQGPYEGACTPRSVGPLVETGVAARSTVRDMNRAVAMRGSRNSLAVIMLMEFASATRSALPMVQHLNISSAAVCDKANDVCTCAALAPGCGWCSSSKTCEPANRCTTTCRECPSSHKTCRSSCRRTCVDTCALVSSVCGCSELDGCGWCKHGNRCAA